MRDWNVDIVRHTKIKLIRHEITFRCPTCRQLFVYEFVTGNSPSTRQVREGIVHVTECFRKSHVNDCRG